MAANCTLEVVAIEDTLYGESYVVDPQAGPGPDDFCVCVCSCETKAVRSSDFNAVGATLSVTAPQP